VAKAQGDSGMRSLVLKGGIAGWQGLGPDFTGLMDGYVAQAWQNGSMK